MRKFLTTLLCLALVLAMMPIVAGTVFADEVTEYDIWVNGETVTSANTLEETGYEYSTETGTLTVSNSNFEKESVNFIKSSLTNLRIVFLNPTIVTATNSNAVIDAGEGSIEISGTDIMISADYEAIKAQNVTIVTGTSLVVNGTSETPISIENGELINNGRLIVNFTGSNGETIKCATLTNRQNGVIEVFAEYEGGICVDKQINNYGSIYVSATEFGVQCEGEVNNTGTITSIGGRGIFANNIINTGDIMAKAETETKDLIVGLMVLDSIENSGTIEAASNFIGILTSSLKQNSGKINAEGDLGIAGACYADEEQMICPKDSNQFDLSGGTVVAIGKSGETVLNMSASTRISAGMYVAGQLTISSECNVIAYSEGKDFGYNIGLGAYDLKINGGTITASVSDFNGISTSLSTATNSDYFDGEEPYFNEYCVYAPIIAGIPTVVPDIVWEVFSADEEPYPCLASPTQYITAGTGNEANISVDGLKTFVVKGRTSGKVSLLNNYNQFASDTETGKYNYVRLEYGSKTDEPDSKPVHTGGGYFDYEAYQKALKQSQEQQAKLEKEAKDSKVKALIHDTKVFVRTENQAKGIKVFVYDNEELAKAKNEGYTVLYDFYNVKAKKAPKNNHYKITKVVNKEEPWYLNTAAKKGSKYYYKAVAKVLDENGKIVTTTELSQGLYGCRTR